MKATPENKTGVAELCMRLGSQEFFRNDPRALEDPARAILTHALDLAHASEMLGTWIQETRRMLHATDVAALARRTRPEHSKEANACPRCKGTGSVPLKGHEDQICLSILDFL